MNPILEKLTQNILNEVKKNPELTAICGILFVILLIFITYKLITKPRTLKSSTTKDQAIKEPLGEGYKKTRNF